MAVAPQFQNSAQLLSSILDSAGDAIVSLEPDYTVAGWNQGAERLFGYTAGEMVGRPFSVLLPPERSAADLAAMASLAAGEHPGPCEMVRRRKDGSMVDVLTAVTPVRDAAGNLTGLVCADRDLSERRRTEKAAQLLSAIVDSSDDAIVSKDLSGIVTSWNRGAERLFGYTAAEMTGKSILTIIPADRQDEEPRILERLRRGERVGHFETIRRRKDGVLVSVSITASPVKDLQGRVVGASKIARDITERQRMEADLRQAQEDLEQFAYAAAHDLKEPLRSQSVFAELLATRCAEKLSAEELEMLSRIRSGASRMQALVTDLLAYAQAARGGEEVAVDAGAALAGALGSLEAAIAESGAKVTTDALPGVTMNPTQFQQLLQNLIGNALKYRREGVRPEVHVAARREGDLWAFSVRDNGIGIPPEHWERVFRPFSRLHGKDRYPGSGMGLAICRRIVERCGGRLWVESAPGGGSVFVFTVAAQRPKT